MVVAGSPGNPEAGQPGRRSTGRQSRPEEPSQGAGEEFDAAILPARSGGAWGSGLSVPELAAIRGAGFQPLGLVLGTSVYRLGAFSSAAGTLISGGQGSYGGSGISGGLGMLGLGGYGGYGSTMGRGANVEQDWYEHGILSAASMAMQRMVDEARSFGAHGVVGVRLKLKRISSPVVGVDFYATGTAITAPGVPLQAIPFTSHLSGQDFAKLLRAGYVPSALVVGVSAIRAYAGWQAAGQAQSWGNSEVSQFSEVLDNCVSIAISRMEAQAASLGDGIVGVDIDVSSIGMMGGQDFLETIVTGTAVVKFDPGNISGAGGNTDLPLPVMRLADRRRLS